MRPHRLVPIAAVVAVLAGCGAPGGTRDRDAVLAATCVSTIVRNGLPAPSRQQAAPERFTAERARLVASGRRFNTVSPYRTVCRAIRDEIMAAQQPATTLPDELGDEEGTP